MTPKSDYVDLIVHHNYCKKRKDADHDDEPDYDQEGMIPHN